MKYFAYGSNMLVQRLQARIKNPVAEGSGFVAGRSLRFHKTSKDGSGKCNLFDIGNPAMSCYGVIYEISSDQLAILDEIEGVGFGYERIAIQTQKPNGLAIAANAYVASPNSIDDRLLPYDWYKDLVLAGARQHDLPPDHILGIESIASMADPMPNRKTRLAALKALESVQL